MSSGQAPNNFQVPRGRYRVDVTKPNYQGQTRIVEVDVAETKPLFFKLEPIPARLEIETSPPGATLYVNGNRARNPYRQDVPPGHIEIFAEAPDYESKTTDIVLVPGERRLFLGEARLRLPYKQRSGRPELFAAATVMGALVGAGSVAAAIGGPLENANVSSLLLVSGGAIAGAIAGALVATPLLPEYIPDNQAFFILGGMWIGAAEGASAGVIWQQVSTSRGSRMEPCPGPGPCRGPIGTQLRAGFVGSLPGWAVGLTAGALLKKHAPTYGRVALIQSGALLGGIMGAVTQVALQRKPYGGGWEYTVRTVLSPDDVSTNPAMPTKVSGGRVYNPTTGKADDCYYVPMPGAQTLCAFGERSFLDLMPGVLIGLNVGLAAGLMGAYLPDQSHYGPTWKRVVLVDLAAGAGAIAGATFGCVFNPTCLSDSLSDPDRSAANRARSIAAFAALGGAAVGLTGGILLTRHLDDDRPDAPVARSAPPPLATFAPMRDAGGNLAPAFAAMGFF